MISPAATLLGAAIAGALAARGTYQLVMIPDLLLSLRRRSVRNFGLAERVLAVAWGPDHRRTWSELGINPTMMLRVSLLFAAAAVPFPLVLHLGWVVGGVLGLGVFGFFPRFAVRSVLQARRKRIVSELPDVLGPMLEAVKLTQSPVDSVRAGLVYATPGSPLREELERVISEARAEHDFPGALDRFARRVGHPLVQDLSRVLAVAFDRRLDPAAMAGVMERLRGLRAQVVDEAIKMVPSVMVGSMIFMFMAYVALGVVALYGMVTGSGGIGSIL